MSEMEFTDEILMAFADGELDDETMRLIEAALETNDELMARVALFMETRVASSDALKPLLDEPVPDQLVEKVRAMAAEAAARDDAIRIADPVDESARADNIIDFRRPEPTAQTPRRPSQVMMALAASLLIVVGGVAGYLAGGAGQMDPGSPQVAGLVDVAVSGILDQRASGEEIAIGDGRVRLVSTFEASGEQICREYEMKRPDQPDFVSVACRSAGGWQTQLAIVTAETGEGFAPASSLETVDAYLTSIGAGAPLEAEAEKKALAARK
ncbi:anti-sigma factor [Ensifer sp. HO-A22]|uniref:Anti-sigma factor n=1 Tax=Ensifer oleiphilus TaxID=2742698 RepID=A0A7Y6Q6Z0_9HYPH|nr:anti-sigma factor [Ensifer oleiphilus]NVD40160.1 anti-sigma factor [Ensifer oleiphilus]